MPEVKTAASPPSGLNLSDVAAIPSFLDGLCSALFGVTKVDHYLRDLPQNKGIEACLDQVLRDRGLDPEAIKSSAQAIPKEGPCLITANHPTGVLDGVLLLAALLGRRKDVRIVANQVLARFPFGDEYVLRLNKASSRSAFRTTIRQVETAWAEDQCVVVFPAGTVEHFQWSRGRIAEAAWAPGIQRFAHRHGIAEYCATIGLKNPRWFHVAAAFLKQARTLLLLRAFLHRSPASEKETLRFHKGKTRGDTANRAGGGSTNRPRHVESEAAL